MRRLYFLLLGLMLMSCRSVKSSTETSIRTERDTEAEVSVSSQVIQQRMQHFFEDMLVSYNGTKDITIYDTEKVFDTDKGIVSPVVARIVVRDTITSEKVVVLHDTLSIVERDTIVQWEENHETIESTETSKEQKTPPFDMQLSVLLVIGIAIVAYKVYKVID